MDLATAVTRLKAHEAELREMGVLTLSVFGSTARGEQRPDSDVDVAATFDHQNHRVGLFRFVAIQDRLQHVLGVPVDLVGEPARKLRMQRRIDEDRVRVF